MGCKTILRKKLITITGIDFFNHLKLVKGMILKLIKEPDNQYGGDAIAVYSGSGKIGYVSNSQKTGCSFTFMVSYMLYCSKSITEDL